MGTCEFGRRRQLFLTSAIIVILKNWHDIIITFTMNNTDKTPDLEINMDDILVILDNSKRPLVEGEAVLLADHILMCDVKTRYNNKVIITSYITQSSKIYDKPHEINTQVSVDNNLKKICCKCSCPAGAGGKCKHIFATLLYINRTRVVHLQTISCTDVRQKWSKFKKTIKLPYTRITSIDKYCHFYKEDAVINYNEVSEETKGLFLKKLLSSAPHSESAIHYSKQQNTKQYFDTTDYSPEYILQLSLIHSLLNRDYNINCGLVDSDCQSDFYKKNVKLLHSEFVILFMKTLGQKNDTWKQARMSRITGSVCYDIYTYALNRNSDWNKKVENIFYSKFEGNSNTNYGTLNEAKGIVAYTKLTNIQTEKAGFFVSPLCPWLGYSADGVAWSVNALIEVKCPILGKTKTASDVVKHVSFLTVLANNEVTFKTKHKYYAQVQLGMMLLGFPKCHFIVYASFDISIFIIELPYNKMYCDKLVNKLREQYFNNILPILEKKSVTK